MILANRSHLPLIACSYYGILSWASRFDDASYEAKHLVIAQLVDRIEIQKNEGYDITIHWRMTAEQFLGRKTEASA